MKSATLTHTKNHLSALIDQVLEALLEERVCLDHRLAAAAHREGFKVVDTRT